MNTNVQQTILLFILAYLIILVFLLKASNKDLFPNQSAELHPTTGLIYEFENFQNDLFQTVKNVCLSFDELIIFSETFIYPPIDFSTISDCSLKLIELEKSLSDSYDRKNLYSIIQNDYLFILPDSTRIVPNNLLSIDVLVSKINLIKADVLLLPFSKESITYCDHFNFDIRRWTLNFVDNGTNCLYKNVNDGFAVFLPKRIFFKLSHPLLRPFVESFLIQSQVLNLKISILESPLFLEYGSKIFSDHHTKAKHDHLEEQRHKIMYAKLGIKKIVNKDNSIEWYGCDRNLPRCFGSIMNDIPEYLIQNRWLPPCCRRNLEITGRYVFNLLEKFHIRYWLEGGSLLGAARNGQIIDWDYDIDIGIYQEDMYKLSILQVLFEKAPGFRIEDGQGFVWEKALEGNFIKIHYSLINRIHVDIFPFVSSNGTMTKDTWFENHPQDMPFPEHFLQPLEQISFIGINVSAPNNVRQFLEMKFGSNAIEQPRYPNNKKTDYE